jgi:threonine synthase
MSSEAGVFGEPASCAPLAGLIKLTQQGKKFTDKVIVCVVTGNGLKDTETALKKAPKILELPEDLKAVEKALGWG